MTTKDLAHELRVLARREDIRASANQLLCAIGESCVAEEDSGAQCGAAPKRNPETELRENAEETGPQQGHFYRTGAARLTGITLGIAAASYVVAWVHPGWRRYIGVLNLSCADAHLGTVVYNVVQNPYYR
jgi:hypothetical protein